MLQTARTTGFKISQHLSQLRCEGKIALVFWSLNTCAADTDYTTCAVNPHLTLWVCSVTLKKNDVQRNQFYHRLIDINKS